MTQQRPTSWQPFMPLPTHPPSIQSLIIEIDPIALAIQCEGLSPLTSHHHSHSGWLLYERGGGRARAGRFQ